MNKGTFVSWISHKNENWTIDNNFYNFGTINKDNLIFYISKDFENYLIVHCIGIYGGNYTLKTKLNEKTNLADHKIMITVTWENNKINLFINDEGVRDSIEIGEKANESKIIKISNTPLSPPIETFNTLVLSVTAPYDDQMVTMIISPSIVDYNEGDKNVKQMLALTGNSDAQQLIFDFRENNSHKINVENDIYNIKLLDIGKEKIERQEFPYFELLVEQMN